MTTTAMPPQLCTLCSEIVDSKKELSTHERVEHWSLVLIRCDLAGQRLGTPALSSPCQAGLPVDPADSTSSTVYQVDRPDDEVFRCPCPSCSWAGSLDPSDLIAHVDDCPAIARCTSADRSSFDWQPVEHAHFHKDGLPVQPKLVADESELDIEPTAEPSQTTDEEKSDDDVAVASESASWPRGV